MRFLIIFLLAVTLSGCLTYALKIDSIFMSSLTGFSFSAFFTLILYKIL